MARAALSLTGEVGFAGPGITRQHVLHLEDWRAAERVVDALPEEIGEVHDLRIGEERARTAAHHLLVSALEQRPDLAAVPIAQDDERTYQVRSILGAARLRPV